MLYQHHRAQQVSTVTIRHCWTHLLKYSHLIQLSAVCSWRSNHQYDSIGLGNGMEPNRRQVRALDNQAVVEPMLIIYQLDYWDKVWSKYEIYLCPWHDVIMLSAIHVLHFVGTDTNNYISTPNTNIYEMICGCTAARHIWIYHRMEIDRTVAIYKLSNATHNQFCQEIMLSQNMATAGKSPVKHQHHIRFW